MTTLEQIRPALQRYEHARHEPMRRFLRFLIRTIGFNFLARIDHVEGVEHIPQQGAAIVMINHIAFIDPLVVLAVSPRSIVPMAKIEVYDYPIIGIFPRLWGVIPVRREEVDRRAIQQALDVLQAGEIILIAPEGTRHPALADARDGIAYLASRSGAPIVPAAIDGTMGFPALRGAARWRAPGVTLRLGRPFRLRSRTPRPGRSELRQMTDEAMYVLAAMLPENRRGQYADLSKATCQTIEPL